MIDTATPGEVAAITAAIGNSLRPTGVARHMEKNSVLLDGTGSGRQQMGIGRMFGWKLARITCATTPPGVATVTFYENEVQPTDLREVVVLPANGLYSDGFDNVLFVPAGSLLIVNVTGGPVNGSLSYNLQIELEPVPHG